MTMSECNGDTSDAASFASSGAQSLSSSGAQSLSSTTDSNRTQSEDKSTESSELLNKTDTTAVNRGKYLVLTVIAVAAVGCGTATYFFAKREESKDFESR